MKVVIFHAGTRTRYMLVDDSGLPVEPVLRFLKYRDNAGRARNTLRVTCYRLKPFWEFLQQEGLSYIDVTLDDLAQYKAWLRGGPSKIIAIHSRSDLRSPRTINVYLDAVLQFYDYLMRHDDYAGNLPTQAYGSMPASFREFKPFLQHVSKGRRVRTNILRSREPRQRPKMLAKGQVEGLYLACKNRRDRLLIRLLWEKVSRSAQPCDRR